MSDVFMRKLLALAVALIGLAGPSLTFAGEQPAEVHAPGVVHHAGLTRFTLRDAVAHEVRRLAVPRLRNAGAQESGRWRRLGDPAMERAVLRRRRG
jgi:hypothetical protein